MAAECREGVACGGKAPSGCRHLPHKGETDGRARIALVER